MVTKKKKKKKVYSALLTKCTWKCTCGSVSGGLAGFILESIKSLEAPCLYMEIISEAAQLCWWRRSLATDGLI